MSQKKADTDQILDAIKNMMSESATVDQELPKDVVELTAPINEEVSQSSANTDVLELTELVSDSSEEIKEEVLEILTEIFKNFSQLLIKQNNLVNKEDVLHQVCELLLF